MSTRSKTRRAADRKFFGRALPKVRDEEFPGHLIVVEGTDGSGRSTQISLLTEWLEVEGYSVSHVGLRRSNLLARNIDELLEKNVATRLTIALLYATDFYDQLERNLLPALRAGSVVLADRYIFSLMARSVVRGIRNNYLKGIYAMALKPELTFWLDVSAETAFGREVRKEQGISYWESGRDMHLSPDLYESFIRYQTRLRKEFERMSKTYEFVRVDSESSVSEVNDTLRRHVAEVLGIEDTKFRPTSGLSHLWR